jgi:hypothetical protein
MLPLIPHYYLENIECLQPDTQDYFLTPPDVPGFLCFLLEYESCNQVVTLTELESNSVMS